MKLAALVSALALSATAAYAETENFTIDSVRNNSYHTLISITINNPRVTKIVCRGYTDGKITGTTSKYTYNKTGYIETAILGAQSETVHCQGSF